MSYLLSIGGLTSCAMEELSIQKDQNLCLYSLPDHLAFSVYPVLAEVTDPFRVARDKGLGSIYLKTQFLNGLPKFPSK